VTRSRSLPPQNDKLIDLLGNWRSVGFRRMFCAEQSVSTAALLCVMQGRDTKFSAKETRKTVLRKFPRRSNNAELRITHYELFSSPCFILRKTAYTIRKRQECPVKYMRRKVAGQNRSLSLPIGSLFVRCGQTGCFDYTGTLCSAVYRIYYVPKETAHSV